jgi:three-Cys-motif partner protein
MDKKGRIQEHSKKKLELFRSYLELYLTVLANSRGFRKIIVHDIFAGRGESAGGEKGSALLAAIEIKKVRDKYPNTPIFLNLNEQNLNNFSHLQNAVTPYINFVSLSRSDANLYISQWQVPVGSHNLFFVDPYGYTQLSTDNLARLFSMQRCDFLMFVPIYHIYRFLRPSGKLETEEKNFSLSFGIIDSQETKAENNKYYEPIAKFLSGLGIEKEDAENAYSAEDFADVIVRALQKISSSDYVYREIIKNADHNSSYCLFYVSKHILGAEKFLEAKSQMRNQIRNIATQSSFDFCFSEIESKSILSFIDRNKIYDNISLYEIGIKNGFLPSELKNELRKLEKNGEILVSVLPGKVRNKPGLYVDYAHYKSREGGKIISIKFQKEDDLFALRNDGKHQ